MTLRHLTLWLLLFIVGLNSTIGLPIHEAMHAENERTGLATALASDMPTDVHSEFNGDEDCASCYTYAQLSLAFIPLGLDNPSYKKVMFIGAVPSRELISSIGYAYPSGCDPPTALA